MSLREEVTRKIVRQWIAKAETDPEDAGIFVSQKSRGLRGEGLPAAPEGG